MYITRMTKPTEITIQAWVTLIRAHQAAFSAVEKSLKEKNLPPLIWYDVLLELDRVGKEGLRPFELEGALLLPQYQISRIIERIEKSGHLRRQSCEDDGRGQRLYITASGKALRREMWPIYANALERAVGAKISAKDAKMMSEILSKLI